VSTNPFDFSGKVTLMQSGGGAHFLANTPMGRVSQPAEIAGMVLFLCSDLASFAVGQTFVIDGGYTTH
jgi:NAD(P)-dependent dehydrogenase (short-subunit alcohol dehydrogenase family)